MSTLVCAEEGATGAYSYDAPTLRHSGTQGAPYLHWARPRWCMERRRLHLGYRNHSDCPGCRSLWGEQDRHRRCEHHHVSAPHDRPRNPSTVEERGRRAPGGSRAVRSILAIVAVALVIWFVFGG